MSVLRVLFFAFTGAGFAFSSPCIIGLLILLFLQLL
jgi:hypothetical protein